MTYDEFNAYCGSLLATSYVNQWGGAHVWKVGGKVFAIGGWDEDDVPRVTFKVSEISYEVLSHQPGLRPAPYFAARGMKWIQQYDQPGLNDEELKGYIADSYYLVALGLTKSKRKELGFVES